jgi:hypothetical protein
MWTTTVVDSGGLAADFVHMDEIGLWKRPVVGAGL